MIFVLFFTDSRFYLLHGFGAEEFRISDGPGNGRQRNAGGLGYILHRYFRHGLSRSLARLVYLVWDFGYK